MKTQGTSKNEPRFIGEVVDIDGIGVVSDFSEDGQAATLIFSNLQVDVGDRQGVFVVSRTVSLSIPVENNDQNLRITQGIRGFVSVDGTARAVLLVQAAGDTTLVDLRKAGKATEQVGNSWDFAEIIEGELRAGAAYHITFFLLVERDVDHEETGASLVIDSLDLEIKGPVEER